MLNDPNRHGNCDRVDLALRRTGFHAAVESAGGCVIVRLQGELDMATSPRLSEALSTALGARRPVVVDLADLTFIDSTGIAVLLEARRGAKESGVSLVVRSPNRPVLKALRLTGVDRILAIEPVGSLAT